MCSVYMCDCAGGRLSVTRKRYGTRGSFIISADFSRRRRFIKAPGGERAVSLVDDAVEWERCGGSVESGLLD